MSNETKKTALPKLRFPEFLEADEWEEKKLGQVGEFIGGGTPDTSKPEYWDGEIQWFTPTEIKDRFLSKSKRTITEAGLRNSSVKLLPKGALLLTTRATVGDISIAENPCTTNQGFQSFVVNDSEVNTFWYYWFIQHKAELLRRASGSTFPEIGKAQIVKISALRPSKEEQQKIAFILSSLDDIITAQNKKLKALRVHKRGLMQGLFPTKGETVPKLRFPEFQESVEWEENTLGEIAKYENGKAHEQGISETGDYVVVNSKFISTEGKVRKFTNTAACVAKKEDTLIVLSDLPNGKAIAKCFFVNADNLYTVNQRIARITPVKANGLMLFYLLNRNKYFLAFDDGVKQTNLKKDDVLNCPLLMPKDLNEQQRIADCLSALDNLISTQIQNIEALKLHKKGLMQVLFPTLTNSVA
jgi:type I restriction enzyme S subunit